MIASVDNSTFPAVVTCLDEARHGLEDGDYVSFSEVGGMDALNEAHARPVKVLGPYTFSVDGIAEMGSHTHGGIVTQVKQKSTLSFKSLREAIATPDTTSVAPEMGMTDFIKIGKRSALIWPAQEGTNHLPSERQVMGRKCHIIIQKRQQGGQSILEPSEGKGAMTTFFVLTTGATSSPFFA